MFALAFIAASIVADPVVPIAGRPVDFSGAVGGPFVVTTTVDRSAAHVGAPVVFTITITGPGDLSQVRRPDLEHNPDFTSRFAIVGIYSSISQATDPATVAFRYTLRPKSAQVDV